MPWPSCANSARRWSSSNGGPRSAEQLSGHRTHGRRRAHARAGAQAGLSRPVPGGRAGQFRTGLRARDCGVRRGRLVLGPVAAECPGLHARIPPAGGRLPMVDRDRLSNCLATEHTVAAVLMRALVPRQVYPGRSRVGVPVNSALDYAPGIAVYDGVDWYWGRSLLNALAFMREFRPQVVVFQWWTEIG